MMQILKLHLQVMKFKEFSSIRMVRRILQKKRALDLLGLTENLKKTPFISVIFSDAISQKL